MVSAAEFELKVGSVVLPRHRLSVADFHRLDRAGVLGEDDRVELVEGELIDMTPIGSRHAATVARLVQLFSRIVGTDAVVWPQNPLRLNEQTEVLPDVALLRPRDDFYASANPGPDDVLLVVEVADTSAAYDRQVKVPLYARHRIPEVWLLDLRAGIEVYCEPVDAGYRVVRHPASDAVLVPTGLPGVRVPMA